ncbi:MAG: hypothetical protein C0599_06385 [Salinivirgaceae bacterium]|nr:MAG: hypothetical protein C0599_06385 [Salinivirgaceae bacterium]
MKRLKNLLFMLGVAALFGSCVTSVHPIYTEEDLIYDEGLLGDWVSEDSTVFSFRNKPQNSMPFYKKDSKDSASMAYYATYYDKVPAEFKVHMVQLDKYKYLDYFIHEFDLNNELAQTTLFPVHTFTKIERKGDSLILTGFDARYIIKLLEERKIRIKHEMSDGNMLLTAPTEELQKFIIKYADDPELFDDDPSVLIRKR